MAGSTRDAVPPKGLATQVDGVGWHPFYHIPPDDPSYRNYRRDVEEFKRQCAALGFDGTYAATEWTWRAPFPGLEHSHSEILKAKYSAQLMTTHAGLDIVSLFNETFQTSTIPGDTTLLRNSSFQCDPITPAQPQPVYYVLQNHFHDNGWIRRIGRVRGVHRRQGV